MDCSQVRVLVIDPSPAFRDALRDATARCGWTTKVAGNSTTGLAIASWFRPTVVVADVLEAGITASAFTTLVRFGREDLLLVGTVDAHDAPHVRATDGIDLVLVKPIAVGELVATISRSLEAADPTS